MLRLALSFLERGAFWNWLGGNLALHIKIKLAKSLSVESGYVVLSSLSDFNNFLRDSGVPSARSATFSPPTSAGTTSARQDACQNKREAL